MASKYSEVEGSARSWHAKAAGLSQEMVRRMMNTSEHLPITSRVEIVDQFTQKLRFSGYTKSQARHCIVAGLINYERKRSSQKIHRSLTEMTHKREIRKVLEKKAWFHDKVEDLRSHTPSLRSGPHRSKKVLNKHQQQFQPAAVLFVPRTEGGRLLKCLREAEASIQEASTRGYKRVKLVEQGGLKLKHITFTVSSTMSFV